MLDKRGIMNVQEKQVVKNDLMHTIKAIETEIKQIKNNVNSGNFDERKVEELSKRLNTLKNELD